MKLYKDCKDCKYFILDEYYWSHQCTHPKNCIININTLYEYRFCTITLRSYGKINSYICGLCGKHARWFERKEK